MVLDIKPYEQAAHEDWESECYSWRDDETGEIYYSMPFEEWYKPPTENMLPISESGESASYSLLLALKGFGKSFIAIDDYLDDPSAPKAVGFTLD